MNHPTGPVAFSRVLVANRGEIAVRIMRTLQRLGIASVAVYSDADRDAPHVRMADVAVRIGPAPAAESYLRADRIVEAALATGAVAVHPGYGFLSEQAAFVGACTDAGLVFVGPPASAIATMGDKISAKRTVSAAGVRVVPGRVQPGLTDAQLIEAAAEIGYPVLVKPSAGGGGKGMRLVRAETDLADALVSARREAAAAFGDDTLFVERFVDRPRHIEVQVLLDAHGGAVHLGERECSLQRRHQKIVEEAPSPLLTSTQRDAMGEQAMAAARACGYVNAGTVEFIVSGDRPDEAYFMEMNTRLQVEHPVTEMVWGLDLVEWQLRIAAGEPLPFVQHDLTPSGHAIEARIYAEDPAAGFLPAPGRIVAVAFPADIAGGTVRVDAGVAAGDIVGTSYDPMIAKVIAHGPDRAGALDRLDAALAGSRVVGIASNLAFLRRVLADPDVRAGALDTELVERRLADFVTAAGDAPSDDDVATLAAVAAWAWCREAADPGDPWATIDGWRVGEPTPWVWRARCVRGEVDVSLLMSRGGSGLGEVSDASVNGGPAVPISAVTLGVTSAADVGIAGDGAITAGRTVIARVGGRRLQAMVDMEHEAADPLAGGTLWLTIGGRTWAFTPHDLAGGDHPSVAERSGTVVSPMPGTVVSVGVVVGDQVAHDQAVVVVEAMKMEHTLRAPFDAEVHAVHVAAGDRVALGAPLVELIPTAPPELSAPDADSADPPQTRPAVG